MLLTVGVSKNLYTGIPLTRHIHVIMHTLHSNGSLVPPSRPLPNFFNIHVQLSITMSRLGTRLATCVHTQSVGPTLSCSVVLLPSRGLVCCTRVSLPPWPPPLLWPCLEASAHSWVRLAQCGSLVHRHRSKERRERNRALLETPDTCVCKYTCV